MNFYEAVNAKHYFIVITNLIKCLIEFGCSCCIDYYFCLDFYCFMKNYDLRNRIKNYLTLFVYLK